MNKVDIYINGFRLDLFDDEEITINLSVQNVQDISKVFTDFNVNSRNSYTLNTGFVGEDHNDVVQDILMSENVAMLVDGSWYAVTPERGSVEYQKHVNQKLINYTMTFNFAFDERSLIR